MPSNAIPVTPQLADAVLERIAAILPEGWIVTPIGGTELQRLAHAAADTTKDVDLVVTAVLAQGPAIPETEELIEALRPIAPAARPRKDQTSVKAHLDFPPGHVVVEVIRGRKGGGGYFVSRRILERVALLARGDGRVRRPPPEALAFLKAWGADDKDKLVASGRDGRGYHLARSRKFRLDVAQIRGLVSRPDPAVLADLLALCGPVRRKAVAGILAEAGWSVRSEPPVVK